MTAVMVLSLTESDALRACEASIERGRKIFHEVGTALLRIRDQRLYRAEHSTFEDYCRVRWNWSRQRAHQQIEAAQVVENLSTTVDSLGPMGPIPETERQARELVGLEPQEQRAAWQEALEENGGGLPTAQVLARVVRRHMSCRPPRPKKEAAPPSVMDDLTEKHRQNQIFHHQLTEAMMAVEILAKLPFENWRRVALNILMADPKRQYETWAQEAQRKLGRLLLAMLQVEVDFQEEATSE